MWNPIWQGYTEELYKKDLHDQENHDGVITHLEPDGAVFPFISHTFILSERRDHFLWDQTLLGVVLEWGWSPLRKGPLWFLRTRLGQLSV